MMDIREATSSDLERMAHRANQGLNQRLFLLSMTTGSSLSTASQILIWGFVISQSSFPCQ